jgi:exosortase/archaeosortase family protein
MAPWHLAPPPVESGGELRRPRGADRASSRASSRGPFRAAASPRPPARAWAELPARLSARLSARVSARVSTRAPAGASAQVPSPASARLPAGTSARVSSPASSRAAAGVRVRPPARSRERGPRPGPLPPPLRHRADGELTAALRRPVTRLYLGLAATWVAFGAGLASLAGGLRFSSTTGELIVVPVVVTVLLHVMIARDQGPWNGRLGHGDYVAVLAAVVLAGGVAWWRPPAELNDAALKRLDLLVLPLVLAAVLVLVLGLRVLVVGAFPLLFAFLTWPYPWTLVETHTVSGLVRVTHVSSPWQTGIVGYLLLAGGTLFLLRGHAARKAAWLVAGLLAVWVATLTRILLLATAGDLWGDGAALQVLHPYAGLTLDALVFVLMLRLAGCFGLSPARPRAVTPGVRTDPETAIPPPAVSQVLVRLALVLVVATSVPLLGQAGAFGVPTGTTADGVHRQTTLKVIRGADPSASFVGSQPWSRAFFGTSSTWHRYRLQGAFSDAGVGAEKGAGRRPSVWLDSITVTSTAALEAHPVLECYTFHRGQVVESAPRRLSGGVTAQAVVVRRDGGDVWYALHWQWPVLVTRDGRDELRYERVVLMTAQPGRTGAAAVARRVRPVTVDRRVLDGLTTTADRLLTAGGRHGP